MSSLIGHFDFWFDKMGYHSWKIVLRPAASPPPRIVIHRHVHDVQKTGVINFMAKRNSAAKGVTFIMQSTN